MVFELKPHKIGTPGVLVFSHKEYKLLFNKKLENKNLNKLKKSISSEFTGELQKTI